MVPIKKLVKDRNLEADLFGLSTICIHFYSRADSNEGYISDSFLLLSNST